MLHEHVIKLTIITEIFNKIYYTFKKFVNQFMTSTNLQGFVKQTLKTNKRLMKQALNQVMYSKLNIALITINPKF